MASRNRYQSLLAGQDEQAEELVESMRLPQGFSSMLLGGNTLGYYTLYLSKVTNENSALI